MKTPLFLFIALMIGSSPMAVPAQGQGKGGKGQGGMPEEMREVIHGLFEGHETIRREVKMTDTGYRATTTSTDPVVATHLQTHVKQMKARLERGLRVRRWDPAFEEFVKHYDEIEIEITPVEGGISVVAAGRNDEARRVAQNHAGIITQFVEQGWSEHDKTHAAVMSGKSGPDAADNKKEPESNAENNHDSLPLSAEQRKKCLELGEKASSALMNNLGTQLKAALAGGDLIAAVSVCTAAAQPITAAVSGDFAGITVTRTSLKTRNAETNRPDATDRDVLEKWAHIAGDSREIEPVIVPRHENEVRYYRPIFIQEACLKCHGPTESMDGTLRRFLARTYPEDQALGYEVGDLRGAFRVEIELSELLKTAE